MDENRMTGLNRAPEDLFLMDEQKAKAKRRVS